MDINFNTSYGDISIVNNDINIIKTKEKGYKKECYH